MKFMGSKRVMLQNGLGEVIANEMPNVKRFVDLFTGSAAVAWYVATQWEKKVLACDLQRFAVAMAAAVICRCHTVSNPRILRDWSRRAGENVVQHATYVSASRLQKEIGGDKIEALVRSARNLCEEREAGPVQRAYGGYYFSPLQTLWIDELRSTLPRKPDARGVALAALLQASSRCAASPGHTAQPFQPNPTAGPFLATAWSKDVMDLVSTNFMAIAKKAAQLQGSAVLTDAGSFARQLQEGDLAFIDPPYSSVQYSRFYHVLETIAEGRPVEVAGAGRYPPPNDRPKSDFSLKSCSETAIRTLLESVRKAGARAIVTFPAEQASNGLSGRAVVEIATEFFRIEREEVTSRFSTLGGNSIIRDARKNSQELILTLSPK
jgi:adenine-specific DNA methylase